VTRMICIVCPTGCEMEVSMDGDIVMVKGNQCPRGIDYARAEMVDPRRTLATTVLVLGGARPLASVRVDNVPKNGMMKAMEEIRKMNVPAPVIMGQTLAEIEVRGEIFSVVATSTVPGYYFV